MSELSLWKKQKFSKLFREKQLKEVEQNPEYTLKVEIHTAYGIEPNMDPNNRSYEVVVLLGSNKSSCYSLDARYRNSNWNLRSFFPMQFNGDHEHVYVYIKRRQPPHLPGPSNGMVVIGRTEAQVPDTVGYMKQIYEILRMDDGMTTVKAGNLIISLEVRERMR